MRLVTFEIAAGVSCLGAVLPDGDVLDLSDAAAGVPEFDSMLALIEAGPPAWEHALIWSAEPRVPSSVTRRRAGFGLRCLARRKYAISCASKNTSSRHSEPRSG